MNKRIGMMAALAAMVMGVQAKVKLPHLVSDNMVIQQQTDVRLWGWAKAGKTVVATTSWSKEKAEAKAAAKQEKAEAKAAAKLEKAEAEKPSGDEK